MYRHKSKNYLQHEKFSWKKHIQKIKVMLYLAAGVRKGRLADVSVGVEVGGVFAWNELKY